MCLRFLVIIFSNYSIKLFNIFQTSTFFTNAEYGLNTKRKFINKINFKKSNFVF